jgi:polysaccharide biosynthesis/export protein
MARSLKACLAIGLSLILTGCASSAQRTMPADPDSGTAAATKALTPAMADGHDSGDLGRLSRLWQERRVDGSGEDYPIGPGDVLGINVPDMEELKNTTVRVSGDGELVLPTVGTLRVDGMAEKELEVEIRRRLEKYLVDPQFSLFVEKYRSRQVAVVGAVAKPGLYDLTSTKDTVLDVLSQAGGRTKDAAQRILLLPSGRTTRQEAGGRIVPSSTTTAEHGPSPEQMIAAGTDVRALVNDNDPIVLDLRGLDRGGDQAYLLLPARPGDVIFVPDAGEVFVQGWVNKPGDYKITPGLTVQGAVGAAGGPMFAADTKDIHLIRIARSGEKVTFSLALDTTDMPVQEGDVVDVPYSAAKIVPYAVASFLGRVGLGAGFNAF